MTKSAEKRVRAAIRKAAGEKGCLLLVNDIAEEYFRGAPLLTKSEFNDITSAIRKEAEAHANAEGCEKRRRCIEMLDISHNLSVCLLAVQDTSREASAELSLLQGLFALVAEYGRFNDLLNELCLTGKGDFSARMQERMVSTCKLFPYHYNISLKEQADGTRLIELSVSDAATAAIFDVIERVKQKSSEFKAAIHAMRDVMDRERVPIPVISERLDGLELAMREHVRLTKRLLYHTEGAGWEQMKAMLERVGDPKLALLEAFPDYDEVPVDKAEYDDTFSFLLSHELLRMLLRAVA